MARLSDALTPEETTFLEERDRDLRHEYRESLAELELFEHPSWRYFEGRLLTEQGTQLKLLETAPLEDVPSVRARLQLARHLLGVPDRLAKRVAELREAAASPETD